MATDWIGNNRWYFDTYSWREVEVRVLMVVENDYICVGEDGCSYIAKEEELFATREELELSL